MHTSSGTRVALRLACMTAALLGVFGLYEVTLKGEAPPTVFETVYSHCVLILVSLNYYSVCKFFFVACFTTRGLKKTDVVSTAFSDGPGYVDVDDRRTARRSGGTEIVKGLPRLTIQNVWILVYGLGLVFFVTGYCMMGIQPVCLACAGIAMGILSVDELVCPRHPSTAVYLVLRWAALVAGLISISLVSVNLIAPTMVQFAGALDLYSIFFGLCLPFIAQFIMIAVRDTRHYSLGTVAQVCEFGFPFTAFLGVFHLSVAYGQRFQINTEVSTPYALYGTLFNQSLDGYYHYWQVHNITAQGLIRTDGPFLLFYGLAPLLMVPAMVCYVECALDGCAVDPMLSLSTALCVQHFLVSTKGPFFALGIYGTVCCAVATLIRVLCEYQFLLDGREPPRLQSESTHLTHNVVWERDARRSQEMVELTHELDEELEQDMQHEKRGLANA